MALPRNTLLLKLLAVAAVFFAALATFVLVNRGSSGAPSSAYSSDDNPAALASASTDTQIRAYQALVRSHPKDSRGYSYLADAYLQKVRESGDASYYTRAGAVLATALRLNPRDPAALTSMGTLALARHDFRGGLRYGEEAHRIAPYVVKPLGVLVDAQVELGRYGEARQTLAQMVGAQPNLASYARVSYWRELHGDLPGAIRAMELAVSAGGQAAENVAYVQTLLGNLYFTVGRLDDARQAYRLALARFPAYVPATAGLAGVEAARRQFAPAIRRYRDAVERLPLPQYVVSLGETEEAAGRYAAGRRDLALVGAEEKLLQANGVNTDVDLALFEASHGSPAKAVLLARRAWAEAPSVRSADALGWALTRAGRPAAGLRFAQRALALGSRDPMFLFHAGLSAQAAGRASEARAYLGESLALNPRFSPLYAPRALRALREARR
ncbi:MAG TPA: tetratricopeptide repeat protein [Thermoleophilaceae bacterium]